MTKQEARQMGEEVRSLVQGKTVSAHIGTWMGRPGVSIAVQLNSVKNGPRVVIHKWNDEETCKVSYNKGDFLHDPDNAVRYGAVEEVAFELNSIMTASHQIGV